MSEFTEKNQFVFHEKLNSLKKVIDAIPGAVIIHKLEKFTVEYMSPWGMKKLGVTPEEVLHLSDKEYHEKYFNPEDAADYVPKILALIEKGDEDEIVTFFQQVRTAENRNWSWYLSTSKIFLKDDNGRPTHMITIACPIDPIHHLTSKVNRLLEENNFLRRNNPTFSSLTKREKELLKYMALGKNCSEISKILNISESTVETHRKNIRKKINAKTNYEIILFAQSFDLI